MFMKFTQNPSSTAGIIPPEATICCSSCVKSIIKAKIESNKFRNVDQNIVELDKSFVGGFKKKSLFDSLP